MTLLISGLVLFLSLHSVAIFAPDLRARLINEWGLGRWKLIYSVLSVLTFILLIYGYGVARQAPVWIWQPPVALRHIALLLTLFAFILLAAAYIPGSKLKARLGHPMFMAVKVWALSHLLANGTLADILLFGGFLAWSVAGFIVHRKRDRAQGIVQPAGSIQRDIAVVGVGVASWAIFAMYLHTLLIGVSPLP
jgi:uncharacterized membrane protein